MWLGMTQKAEIYDAVGCPYCNQTGYLGRIGVFEIMVINEEIRSILMSDDFTSEKIGEIVERDMTTILNHTKERVLAGETSMDEYEDLVDVIVS